MYERKYTEALEDRLYEELRGLVNDPNKLNKYTVESVNDVSLKIYKYLIDNTLYSIEINKIDIGTKFNMNESACAYVIEIMNKDTKDNHVINDIYVIVRDKYNKNILPTRDIQEKGVVLDFTSIIVSDTIDMLIDKCKEKITIDNTKDQYDSIINIIGKIGE